MKKNDLIAVPSQRRSWYSESYVPLTRGEVRRVTASEVTIYWYDTKREATYPAENITEKGEKKAHKDGKEYNVVNLKKERK